MKQIIEVTKSLKKEIVLFNKHITTQNSNQKILNLGNKIFKKEYQNPQKGITRQAFEVRIYDKDLTQDDAYIINSLPNKDKTTLRVKDNSYGNHNAMWELLTCHLYSLTGLKSPDNKFAVLSVEEQYGDTPKVLIASPMIEGYQDLGQFLTSEDVSLLILKNVNEDDLVDGFSEFKKLQNTDTFINKKEMIGDIKDMVAEYSENSTEAKQKQLTKWYKLRDQIIEINQREIIRDEDKILRINLYTKIYDMLPDYFHNEIEKSYAASKFIANWDFANFDLSNIGIKLTKNNDGDITNLESAFVDFGNSGAIGFKGKYKEDSLSQANSAAKTQDKNPTDYDPALTLTDEEINFLKIAVVYSKCGLSPDDVTSTNNNVRNLAINKAISYVNSKITESNLTKRDSKNIMMGNNEVNIDDARGKSRRIIFKLSNHILESESSTQINKATTGFLTISDIPRHVPFRTFLENLVKHKTKTIEDYTIQNSLQEQLVEQNKSYNHHEFYKDSEIEIAFRLSLITDQAIRSIVERWFLTQTFPTIFPIPENFKNDSNYNSSEGIINLFKKRRDDLVSLIPEEVVNKWIVFNPLFAVTAEREVELSIMNKIDIINYNFDLQNMIINNQFSFKSRFERAKNTKFDLDPKSDLEKQIHKIRDIIDLIKDRDETLSNSEDNKYKLLISFIEQNQIQWQQSLNLTINCGLFNIESIRTMSENSDDETVYKHLMYDLEAIVSPYKPKNIISVTRETTQLNEVNIMPKNRL